MTTTEVRTNQYADRCRKCHRDVPAGEGRLINAAYGARFYGRGAKTNWKVECLDAEACQLAHDQRPDVIAAAEKQTAKHAALVAEAAEKLAALEARDAVPAECRTKSFAMPDGTPVKVRKIKSGVRTVFDGDMPFDHIDETAAIVFLAGWWKRVEREAEGRRVMALPMPPVGATYRRQFRMGCKFQGVRVDSTGTSMFLGTAHVPQVGEMAICAELMVDGSWLGYRDNLHTVKRGWAGELAELGR